MPVSATSPPSSPYVHVKEDGMVSAANNQVAEIEVRHQENMDENKSEDTVPAEPNVQEKQNAKVELTQPPDVARSPERDITDIVAPVKRCLNQLSRQNRKSLWLLAYIAILTTWPVVGSALSVFLRKRFQDLLSRASANTDKRMLLTRMLSVARKIILVVEEPCMHYVRIKWKHLKNKLFSFLQLFDDDLAASSTGCNT
ncbi:UNVERIFIED_CONTAM: hypothetical protein Sradi_2604100 [Sesamum radiatum]|uniref:Uncharacterized protein n=1 Tax=Sesamum radiatum TaxID=300843 RepID=A0AAW2S430_SESRA